MSIISEETLDKINKSNTTNTDWSKIDWSNVPDAGGMTGGLKPTYLSKEQILANALNDYRANLPETFSKVKCNDGTVQSVGSNPLGGRVDMPCKNNRGVSLESGLVNTQQPIKVPQGVGQKKQTFLEKHQNHLIIVGVPLGFYAFSKYKKYDNKKTAKVTIIGSVVVLGAIVLNSLSGMWNGTTFMDSKFGQQKYW